MPDSPIYPFGPPSSPPVAHAASHEPGGVDDLFSAFGHLSASVIEPYPSWAMIANAALTSGTVYLSYFTAGYSPVLANFVYENRGALTSGITLGRMGLYRQDATQLTKVCQSASSTTLGNVVNTETILAFDGSPATYTPTRGQLYAMAIILVGTTPGNMPVGGQGMNSSMGTSATRPKIAGSFAGQTDLPATIANASVAQVAALFYMAATT